MRGRGSLRHGTMLVDVAIAWLRVRKQLGHGDTSQACNYFSTLDPHNPLWRKPDSHVASSTYPRVQFKSLGRSLLALGLQEGADFVERHCRVAELVLAGKRVRVWQCLIQRAQEPFGPTEQPVLYQFLTPWVALNKENYRSYKHLDSTDGRMELLGRVLVGNVLSAATGLGLTIASRLTSQVVLDEAPVSLKGEAMTGFMGNFSVNFDLPDYLGLGKGAGRGFGTVRRRQPR